MRPELECLAIRLELRNAFTLAHGSSDARTNLFVRLGPPGDEGWGEIPVVPYYAHDPERFRFEVAAAASLLEEDPFRIDDVLDRLEARADEFSAPVRDGIDVALHDRAARRAGAPLHRWLGLDPERVAETSFTLALDSADAMAERARASRYPILKLKLGRPEGDEDLGIVRAVREATSARLRLDVNGGWTRAQAARLIPPLLELPGVELIEQPLPRDDREGFAWLRARVGAKAPIYADESVQGDADLLALAPSISGVVVKLMKTGGLRGARRMIALARTRGLRVMLSCMVESSLGVTAAAAGAGALADEIDLDGPLLIANDPFTGLVYRGARLNLPAGAGLGLVRRDRVPGAL